MTANLSTRAPSMFSTLNIVQSERAINLITHIKIFSAHTRASHRADLKINSARYELIQNLSSVAILSNVQPAKHQALHAHSAQLI